MRSYRPSPVQSWGQSCNSHGKSRFVTSKPAARRLSPPVARPLFRIGVSVIRYQGLRGTGLGMNQPPQTQQSIVYFQTSPGGAGDPRNPPPSQSSQTSQNGLAAGPTSTSMHFQQSSSIPFHSTSTTSYPQQSYATSSATTFTANRFEVVQIPVGSSHSGQPIQQVITLPSQQQIAQPHQRIATTNQVITTTQPTIIQIPHQSAQQHHLPQPNVSQILVQQTPSGAQEIAVIDGATYYVEQGPSTSQGTTTVLYGSSQPPMPPAQPQQPSQPQAGAAGSLNVAKYGFKKPNASGEEKKQKEEEKRKRQAEAARQRYHRLSAEEKKELNVKRTLAQKRRRQREKEMEELEAILRASNDIQDDPEVNEQLREKRMRAKWAEAARTRYQRMSPEERKAYNIKRRMRQLSNGLLKNANGEVIKDPDAIQRHIKEQNAKKAEAARLRYHRMSEDEKKAYNQKRTEAFRRRRMEEEMLLAMPIGRINGEALDRAQQIVIRNAKRAEAARLRYQRMTPEQRKAYNQKRYTPKRKRTDMSALDGDESSDDGGDPKGSQKSEEPYDALQQIERDVLRKTQQAQQIIMRQRASYVEQTPVGAHLMHQGHPANGQTVQQVLAAVPSGPPQQVHLHQPAQQPIMQAQSVQYTTAGNVMVAHTVPPQMVAHYSSAPPV
ncbi:hypothetical protein QR680_012994 [Steinernema hermaphroditum]|uniref:Uncharacterized protein n=1 Tax=Steinernema hermaphroditum TaxID=289476 RepID=A0AA39I409_9BILA|nr:hypothetical protein QR680_012994 [Steinernema hermaphroditum]